VIIKIILYYFNERAWYHFRYGIVKDDAIENEKSPNKRGKLNFGFSRIRLHQKSNPKI